MAKTIRNPAFDVRRGSSGAVDSNGHFVRKPKNPMYRGRLESIPNNTYGSRSTIYQMYFLYNPVAVQHTSSVDPTFSPTQLYTGEGSVNADPTPFLNLQQNVSFNLLLDRTYETWVPSKSYLSKWGVLADLKVLYAMLGMYSTWGAENIYGDVDPAKVAQVTPTSVHGYQPCWAIFGPLLKYHGAITNFSVEYTHFTQAMVPNRATVQIGMQLIPTNATSFKGPGSTSTSKGKSISGQVTANGKRYNKGLM